MLTRVPVDLGMRHVPAAMAGPRRASEERGLVGKQLGEGTRGADQGEAVLVFAPASPMHSVIIMSR